MKYPIDPFTPAVELAAANHGHIPAQSGVPAHHDRELLGGRRLDRSAGPCRPRMPFWHLHASQQHWPPFTGDWDRPWCAPTST